MLHQAWSVNPTLSANSASRAEMMQTRGDSWIAVSARCAATLVACSSCPELHKVTRTLHGQLCNCTPMQTSLQLVCICVVLGAKEHWSNDFVSEQIGCDPNYVPLLCSTVVSKPFGSLSTLYMLYNVLSPPSHATTNISTQSSLLVACR